MNDHLKAIADISSLLIEENVTLKDKNEALILEINILQQKIELCASELKLKDSRIAAYERSNSAKLKDVKKKTDTMSVLSDLPPSPKIDKPSSPKIVRANITKKSPKAVKKITIPPKFIINSPLLNSLTDEAPEDESKITSNTVMPIAEPEKIINDEINIEESSAEEDEFELLNLDDETYYVNTETRELFATITKNKKIYRDELIGKLKTFKTKTGILYIVNSYTNKVYHTNEYNEVLDHCGNIIHNKLKLL